MIYKLDIPDYRLEPREEKGDNVHKLTDYELWEIHMEMFGKWVPQMGETIYIPYDDDIDCWSETWEGNMTQQEYAEQGLIFATANEAVTKARQDMEAVLYGDAKTTA